MLKPGLMHGFIKIVKINQYYARHLPLWESNPNYPLNVLHTAHNEKYMTTLQTELSNRKSFASIPKDANRFVPLACFRRYVNSQEAARAYSRTAKTCVMSGVSCFLFSEVLGCSTYILKNIPPTSRHVTLMHTLSKAFPVYRSRILHEIERYN